MRAMRCVCVCMHVVVVHTLGMVARDCAHRTRQALAEIPVDSGSSSVLTGCLPRPCGTRSRAHTTGRDHMPA